MIEIITKDWPLTLWNEVVEWCYTTYGPGEWSFGDDYSIYINEQHLSFFKLRWG
jgi:hypothetical protein